MWQAGIGVSLPVYRKRISSGVAEAEALWRSGERLVESLRLQLRFRAQERLAQLEATERIATLYGEGIVPQDRMSVDAALANYQTGKVPFITVLEALTTLYNDRTTHVGLLANHERIRASLEEASLEETSGMTPAGGAGMPGGGSSPTMAGAGSAGSGSMSNR
jgi:outer membrane protein TolC